MLLHHRGDGGVEVGTGGQALVAGPEDLGRTRTGVIPVSMWHHPAMERLREQTGVCEGALCQSDFGAVMPKPTRFAYVGVDFKDLLADGAPQLRSPDGAYEGPLRLSGAPARIKTPEGRALLTTAWPEKLWSAVASRALE